jgi:hypothetical protein
MAKTDPDSPKSAAASSDSPVPDKAAPDKTAAADHAKAAKARDEAKTKLDEAKAAFDKAQAEYDEADAKAKAIPPTGKDPYVLVDDGLGNLAVLELIEADAGLAKGETDVRVPILTKGGATYRHKSEAADGRWIYRVD